MRKLNIISLNNFVSGRGVYYGEYGMCSQSVFHSITAV